MARGQIPPHLAAGGIVLALAMVMLVAVFTQPKTYPHIESKYDYEDLHMQTAMAIFDRKPDGYVHNQLWVEDRTYNFILGNLIFYNNRGDDKHLDKAVELLRIMETRTADSNGDGLKDFAGYYTHAGTIHVHGRITQLYAEAVHLIREKDVKKYEEDAARWEELLDDHLLPYIENYWRPYETADGEKRGYYKERGDNSAIPFNQGAAATVALLRRGIDTSDQAKIEIGERYLNRFFGVNQIAIYNETTYLAAKYYLYDAESGEQYNGNTYLGLTDVSHLNAEFEFILFGYEQRMVTDNELQLIIDALRVMMTEQRVQDRMSPVLNQNMAPPRQVYSDETDINIWEQTGQSSNFIRFGMKDSKLVHEFEEILRNGEIDGKLQGSYYSIFYRCVRDPRVNDLEYCSQSDAYRVEDMTLFIGIANLGRFQ